MFYCAAKNPLDGVAMTTPLLGFAFLEPNLLLIKPWIFLSFFIESSFAPTTGWRFFPQSIHPIIPIIPESGPSRNSPKGKERPWEHRFPDRLSPNRQS